MKKMLLGLLIVMIMGMATFALADDEVDCSQFATVILGKVYSGNTINTPVVPDVEVQVTCNSVIKTDTTNDLGRYAVMFDSGVCPPGQHVSACVGTVCGHGTVETCLEENNLNILGVDIFNVPEFGVAAASIALAGAVAGFIFLRKRK